MLALIPPDFADPEADYLAVRAMMAPFHGHPVPAYVSVEEAVLGGVRVAWCDDTTRQHDGTTAFHCHGGGLVSCPLDDYLFYGAMLSEQLGLRVVLPDYRLAPSIPIPPRTRTVSMPTAGCSTREPTPRGSSSWGIPVAVGWR
jgi:acetyl esterase/lipase